MLKKEKKPIGLSKGEVVKLFNISTATLDNWIRTSIPDALVDNFYDVEKLNGFIKAQNKLSKRANKKNNNSIELPKELLLYLTAADWVSDFILYANNKSKDVVSNEIVNLYSNRLANIRDTSELGLIIPHADFYSYSVAYQIILNSGDKSKSGAYYTPKFIVEESVNSLVAESKTFLEPCSGVGFEHS